jgi:hypothetical protein
MPVISQTQRPPSRPGSSQGYGGQQSGALFLGIELATDQIRASIVDENLELVGVEVVDFDSELPEYACVSFPFLFIICVLRCHPRRCPSLLVFIFIFVVHARY